MKIFSWMQSKLTGDQRSSKPSTTPAKSHLMHETCKEEFSDWPSGLLAIGTFGNNSPKDPEKYNLPEEECVTQEHQEEITHEEIKELHKELILLLDKQPAPDSDLAEESATNNLQKFDDDRSTASEDGHYQRKRKDSQLDKKKNISKRSLSFLLRKAFHRTGKSRLSPLLKDPIPELKLEKSRMEKILRALLNKKIYPQSSNPKAPIKKCLDNKHELETDSEDEMIDNTNEGSKWVKTDSDFIVLEI